MTKITNFKKFMSMCSNVRTEKAWLNTTGYVHDLPCTNSGNKHHLFSAILLSHHIQRDATVSPPTTAPANNNKNQEFYILKGSYLKRSQRNWFLHNSGIFLLRSSLRCPRVTLIAKYTRVYIIDGTMEHSKDYS